MGFFSWLTADTKETIANTYTDKHREEGVYLLCPDGSKIHEPFYEGYGIFGEQNAYVLLGRQNSERLGVTLQTDEEAFSLGVSLDCGVVYIHSETTEIWHIFHTGAHCVLGGRKVHSRFNEYSPELGMEINKAIEIGLLKPTPVATLVDFLPLKFSFDPEAEYHKLGPSEICPHQGFFYE